MPLCLPVQTLTYFYYTLLLGCTYCSLDPEIPFDRHISPSHIPHCHYSHLDNLQNMDLSSKQKRITIIKSTSLMSCVKYNIKRPRTTKYFETTELT